MGDVWELRSTTPLPPGYRVAWCATCTIDEDGRSRPPTPIAAFAHFQLRGLTDCEIDAVVVEGGRVRHVGADTRGVVGFLGPNQEPAELGRPMCIACVRAKIQPVSEAG